MQAVILAAGCGSRLSDHGPSKPLVEVAGRALLHHALTGLAAAGIDEAIVVLGHRADAVRAALGGWSLPLAVKTVEVADASLPNGLSVLAAAPCFRDRGLLTMCDHLVEPGLYARLAGSRARPGELLLGVDRRLGHDWVDEDDVTRVETHGNAIVAIGKRLQRYNGYDTGVFSIDAGLLAALAKQRVPSLSEGVAALASSGLARAVESGDCAWLDVDDPRALRIAELWLGQEAVS